MTKLYMHHFCGGLVYCPVQLFFLFLYHSSICLICKSIFTKKGCICQYSKFPYACLYFPHFDMCWMVPLSVQHIYMNIQHQCTNGVTGKAKAVQ